jgi:surfeit locus 1 family protein
MKVRVRWPGWIPTLAAALGLALTLAAANWQFDRAAYKHELANRYDARQAAAPIVAGQDSEPDDMAFRRVEATGLFHPDKAVWLDNRVHEGKAGFQVIMPLELSNKAGFVVVNRGWVAANRDRSSLPYVTTPQGVVTVQGVAVVPSETVFELSERTVEGRTWQNFTLSRYRKAYSGLDLRGYVIRQSNDLSDGLNRQWAAPGSGVERNRIYAVQWLIFACLILGFYVYFGFVRRSSGAQ